jgi:hypothetical protein
MKDIGWILGLVISLIAGGGILWFIDKETLIALNVNVFRYEILAAIAALLMYRFRSRIADLLGLDADLRNWRSVFFAPFALIAEVEQDDRRNLVAPALACAYLAFAWCVVDYAVNTVNFVTHRYMDGIRQGMLAQAVEADKSGNYAAAVAKYREVLQQFPDDIRNRIIRGRIASIGIQTEYGGRRLAALDPRTLDVRSVAYLDATITVCSINAGALPCRRNLLQHQGRIETALTRLSSERRPCAFAAKSLDSTLLIDERDRKWLKIGADDTQALCAFSGTRNSTELKQYLERRWRVAEVRRWLKANSA